MKENPRILIVEDESIAAMGLKGRLENLGYTVLGVIASGKEAIEQFEELRPDLVLMDIRLNKATDGVEAAEQIRVISDIPVVVLTTHAGQAISDRVKLAGPLLESVEERGLCAAVEFALAKHRLKLEMRMPVFDMINSLASILGFAELLRNELDASLWFFIRHRGRLRKDVLSILEAAQRAAKVQGDLRTRINAN